MRVSEDERAAERIMGRFTESETRKEASHGKGSQQKR